MKRLNLGLAVLLAGLTTNSVASLPSSCKASVPSYRGGFNFGLTGLYWTGRSSQQDYATVFSNFNETTFMAFGDPTDLQLHSRYEGGYKLNLGYIFPCSGNDVNVTYTNWDHKNKSNTSAGFTSLSPEEISLIDNTGPSLTFVIPLGFVGAGTPITTQILPAAVLLDQASGFILGSPVSRVSAKSEYTNQTWDLEFGQAINVGCNFHLRWLGGLRYTELENKVDTILETSFSSAATVPDLAMLSPGSFISTDGIILVPVSPGALTGFETEAAFTVANLFHNHSKFNGLGPRFGIDTRYDVGAGFRIVGDISTSLIIGRLQNTFDNYATLSGTFAGEQGMPSFLVEGSFDLVTAPLTVVPFASSTLVVSDRERKTRVVPNIDAKLGLDWSFQFSRCSRTKMTIEAGYLVSHYFDSIDRITITNTRHTIDKDFDGPYASIQVAI